MSTRLSGGLGSTMNRWSSAHPTGLSGRFEGHVGRVGTEP